MKRFLCFGVIFALALTGCSSQSNGSAAPKQDVSYTLDPNTPAWQLDQTPDTTLTWYINADWFDTSYGTDVITKQMKDDLHLDVQFLTGDSDKLNTYFASQDVPDLVTIFAGETPSLQNSASQWAYDLNGLADAYDPYFYNVINQETFDWYAMDDGLTYCYPSYSNTKQDYDDGLIQPGDALVVRKDVYEAIGSPDMSTPDGFMNGLSAIKKQYPDLYTFGFESPFGSGGSNGILDFKLQNQLGVPIKTSDDQWYDRNLDPTYLDWVKVLNHAHNAGYISDDLFTLDGGKIDELLSTGQFGSFFLTGAQHEATPLSKVMDTDPNMQYIPIDGPKGDNPPKYDQAGLDGWSLTYVSKNCTSPSKAIQLYTYMLSDTGQYLVNFGVENETYTFNSDGKAVLNDDVKQMQQDDPTQFEKQYRINDVWMFQNDEFRETNGVIDPVPSIDPILNFGQPYLSSDYFILSDIDPEPGTEEARNLTDINTQWGTTLANLISAPNDDAFDKTLQDYQTFLDQHGMDAITQIRTDNMQNNEKKLGLE